ncbi:MAG: carboxypeptidase regulatory-like domain-containing protein [Bryobacteraceae bacterium]|nr:carboxypeptidase regulatory-like domain-containing protein [Bryobacteraceae bacterium]
MCNFLRSLRGPVFAALLTIVLIAAVTAQTPKASSLKGQVLDPSGSVVPGATVMLQQPAGGAVKSVTSDSLGKFSVVGLTAGPYNIVVKKKGFAVYQMQSFPVSGDGSIDIQLAVASSVQEMTVNDDRAHVEVSPDQNASALSLKGSDLDALSDDPDELQDDLEALAGPSAGPNGGQIYIDGFSGGTLPPKASIREVRVNSNPFSPEYDRLGYGRIEIFTKPGMDQFRGQVSLNFNDNAFNARNPFLGSTDKPSYQSRQYNGNLAGPLTKKMSFTFDFERRSIDEYGIEIGQQLDPNSLLPVSFSNAIPTPLTRTSLIPKIDMTLNDKNNLTIRYHWTDNSNTNSGVSGFNLASKAVNTQSYDNTIQATETAVLNSRAVTETRFMYDRSKSNSNALSSAPALSVSDAFNSGGSTVGQAWNRQNYYELSNVTTYTAGVHTLKWGGRMRVSDSTDYSPSNFNGSFSFTGGQAALLDAQDQPIVNADGSYVMGQESSLERYRRTLAFQQLGYAPALIRALGGGATTFTMAGGNPLAAIDQTDVGIFVSDDWRVRPTFTLSLGLRYENQTNIDNMADFAPRLGFAWAIGGGKNKVAKTVIRGGAGLFYDRVSSSVALAEFRYNGTTQQQYVVPNPDFFPNIPTLSTLATDLQPSSITKGYAGLVAPRIAQTGLSVERQLPKNTTATVTWAFSRGMHYLLTRDINAPLADGTYPLAQQYQSNQVMLYESAGLFTQNQLIVNVNSRMSKKVSLFGFYTLGYANGNSDGGSPMNQYDLRSEWGPTRWDTRHRFFIGGSITAPLKVVFSPFITGASGSPFNIVTGNDFNNDQIYNARPAFATDPSAPGVVATSYGLFNINPQPGDKIIPRNYGRGPAQFNLNLRMARTWGFGKTKEGAAGAGGPGGPGGGAFAGMGRGPRGGGPGGPGGMFGGADTGRRFNLTASVSARNLLNRENFASPESNLGSPLFGQSLALQSGFGGAASVYNRRVDMQLRLTF